MFSGTSTSAETPVGTRETQRSASRPREIIPLLTTLAAGLFVYGLFYNRGIWLSVVGYSVAPAERVLGGQAPYRDFLFNYTPGILWLNAGLMKAFGAGLLPIHGGLFAFKLSTLAVLFLLGKRLMCGWLALVPVGLCLCWLGHRFIFNVHPTQYSMLFVLGAIITTIKFDDSGDARWLAVSGLLIGLVFVFKYNVGLILLGTGSAAIILRDAAPGWSRAQWRSRAILGRAFAYWLGFGLVAAAMCGYLATRGALLPMVDHFLHHAADYSEERAVGLPPWRLLLPAGTGLLTAAIGLELLRGHSPRLLLAAACGFAAIGGALVLIPARSAILKDAATAAVAYFPAFTFFAAACWICFRLWKRKRDRGSVGPLDSERRLMVVACFALGAYLEVYPRADYYHLVRVLPPVFVLFTMLVFNIVSRQRASSLVSESNASEQSGIFAGKPVLGLALVVVVMLAFTGIKDTWLPQFDGWFRLSDRFAVATARTEGIKAGEYQAGMIEELTNLIDNNSSPGDSVFSFARRGAGFYFFAARVNPTRLLWWDSAGIKAADRAAVLDMIEAGRLRLVLIQTAFDDQQVRRTIADRYNRIAIVEDIEIFGRNDAGPR